MSDEKDLQQLKKEAAERAKRLARERMAAKEQAEKTSKEDTAELPLEKLPSHEEEGKPISEERDALELAKQKAAAAAKAKAAALAKQKAQEPSSEVPGGDALELAKQKAAAAAKAKAAALAKQQGDGSDHEQDLAKEKAKAIAAAKAKAAAAAKAKAAAGAAETAKPEETPSPNQPLLDKYIKVIHEHLGEDVLEAAYINRLSKDVPTLVAKRTTYYKVAQFLKYNEQLGFDYLSELHGTDFGTHMEVYVHLYSYKNDQPVALKVKLDRDHPEIESLVPLWPGANWPECEAYDLLGIRFQGHPNLIRIFLGENWVGHPLRKDYEPYDVEV
ncbi:NADH-quinone oxidoreductase subunit C [Anoxybacillus sp. UARK-01]|uniref:NADH-quinone oxidoreductase subunit C n=2 Tax=Anoxybacteroides rupiense TaxID=311460 RepID=A0ABD5IX08_9BACL|nr:MULTISPECIES: NADH-quinone oxidoreductase subunit C [Anoxybacillus]MED5052363.1 NADH-quinone oxidoreductase subunit C [Anoxybacillus rupiensis]OQM47441.1 NADH-quinone oxidoreductase subunit C [Anoxybacillus sp. UARK-01]